MSATPTAAATVPSAPSDQSAKFTVTASSGTYTAKRADGSTLTSGTDAATVINAALNGLTAGRTTKEKVSLQGTFSITSYIKVPSYSNLDSTGAKLVWGTSTSGNMIYATSRSNIDIVGGDWNKNNVPWEIFIFASCTDINIKDLKAYNDNYDGISIGQCYRVTVSNVEICNVGHTALVMNDDSNCVLENSHIHDCGYGGCYFTCLAGQ